MVYLYRASIPNADLQLEDWLVETDVVGIVKQAYNPLKQQYWVCPSYDTVAKLDTLAPISLPMYVDRIIEFAERIIVNVMIVVGRQVSNYTLATTKSQPMLPSSALVGILDTLSMQSVVDAISDIDKITLMPFYQATLPISVDGINGVCVVTVPKL